MKTIFILFLVLAFHGCDFAPKTPILIENSVVRSKPVVHIVKSKNENLSGIVKWYTKDISNLKTILKYNGKLSGYRLKVGDSILIPERIVKERRTYNTVKILPRKSVSTIVTSKGIKKNVPKVDNKTPVSRGKKELKKEFVDDSVSKAVNANEGETPPGAKPVLPDHPLVMEHEKNLQVEIDLDQKRHKYLLELNQK